MPRDKQSKSIVMKTAKSLWVILKYGLLLIFLFAFLAGGIAAGYVAALVKDDPVRPKEEILAKMQEDVQTGFVYFNDGTLVGQLRSEEDRQLIEIEDIPQHIKDAFLAIEDDDFENHIGIDIMGVLRAVKQRLLNEPIQTGGSTITQQVARRVFLSLDQSMSRKAKEIFLALRIERYMTKDQIFLAYLNKIPFGNSSTGNYVYGIQAAAKGIFDVNDLDELNIAQAAYLAGLPQDPNSYSAFTSKGEFNSSGFEQAIKRQQLVLKRMLEEDKITQEQYEEALAFDIKASLASPKQRAYNTYPFLMLEVERRAAELLYITNNSNLEDVQDDEYFNDLEEAHKELLRGGYHIYTTIDKEVYDRLQQIAQNPENFTPDHEEKGVEQVGAMVIDNDTGSILGMIEGRDYYIEQLNHATQMVRQPGSTMKTLAAFLPALENGEIQPASVIDDIPIMLVDGSKGYHIPNNWDMKFHGIISARTALNQSYNIPALKLFNEVVGIEQAWDFVNQLGITTITEKDYEARTGVIGGLEYGTTVEELTNAYASIPNNGQFIDAFLISRIEDAKGNVIYEHKSDSKQVFSEETAFLMTDMLKTVITSGTGRTILSNFNHYGEVEIAGKTGSTQNDENAWFVGFSPDITVGVWVGYDMPSTLIRGEGTLRAMKIWSMIMDSAIELRPEWFDTKSFEPPDGVIRMTVSSTSGKLPSSRTYEENKLVTDWFNKQFIPTEEDDSLVEARAIRYNGMYYIAHPSTPDDMVIEKVFIKRPEPVKELYEQLESFLDKVSWQNRPRINNRAATLDDYYPLDWDNTAPEEIDPRKDDGKIPEPPKNLKLEQGENQNKITFEASPNQDVVGYRFYRSINGGTFKTNPAQNVLTGDPLQINDYITPSYHYTYYITAVDVAGNESAPSEIVTTYENLEEGFPYLQNQEDQVEDEKENDEIMERDDTTNSSTNPNNQTGIPSAPEQVQIEEIDSVTVKITWEPNPTHEQVQRYYIYNSDQRNGEYHYIGTSNSTEFEYMHLNIRGWFAVAAVNKYGTSSLSEPVEVQIEDDEENE